MMVIRCIETGHILGIGGVVETWDSDGNCRSLSSIMPADAVLTILLPEPIEVSLGEEYDSVTVEEIQIGGAEVARELESGWSRLPGDEEDDHDD